MRQTQIKTLNDLINYSKRRNTNLYVKIINNSNCVAVIYSYQTPIAVIVNILKEGDIEQEMYILVRWHYSTTTVKHRNIITNLRDVRITIPYDYYDFTNLLKFYNIPLGKLQ